MRVVLGGGGFTACLCYRSSVYYDAVRIKEVAAEWGEMTEEGEWGNSSQWGVTTGTVQKANVMRLDEFYRLCSPLSGQVDRPKKILASVYEVVVSSLDYSGSINPRLWANISAKWYGLTRVKLSRYWRESNPGSCHYLANAFSICAIWLYTDFHSECLSILSCATTIIFNFPI